MAKINTKIVCCKALTIIEMIVALSIITIIFAAVLPQFRLINNSWESKRGNAEVLQNGRVLIDHIQRNLSKAVMITSVSDSSETDGFIEFQDNDGNNLRYEIGGNNYIQFGPVGSLSDLAGPVSSLQFTCYDINDFNTSIVDGNSIRFINVQTTLPNSGSMGQDKTLSTSVYLRTAPYEECTSGLVGWWKLDDASGTTATDSSGEENDGTLVNNPSWTTGQISGAVNFDGVDDYISASSTSALNLQTAWTISVWVNFTGNPTYEYIVTRNTSATANMQYGIYVRTPGSGGALGAVLDGTLTDIASFSWSMGSWTHIAVTWDGSVVTGYVNGESIDSFNSTGTLTDQGDWLNIGRRSNSADGTTSTGLFDGLIDDVRVYNRALEATEIAQLASVLRYDSFEETKVGTANTSITITTPSTDEDDLLIAAVATYGDTSASLSPPAGQNWTEIDVDDYGSGVTLGAWWKLADATEAATHQFTWTGSQQAYGWMMRFTGHDTSDPIDTVSVSGQSSSTPTSPSVTTTVNNCMVLRLGGFQNDNITVDAPGLSGHTAITMDKSASASGNVTMLGSWVAGLTHTRESGSNRALIFIAHGEYTSALNLSSVSYGGQAMTKVVERNYDSSGYAYTVAYILKETGVAAATSSTFSVTWATTPTTVPVYSSAFFSNVNQTTSTGATGTGGTTSNTVTTSSSLATANGDMVILGATCGNVGSFTLNNGFTEGTDQDSGNYTQTGVTGHKAATGANETPSATYSGTVNRQCIIGLVLKGNPVSNTVSGGAGYVNQTSAGASGTSTFSLTSAGNSQMITIAIAPLPDDTQSCYGDLRP